MRRGHGAASAALILCVLGLLGLGVMVVLSPRQASSGDAETRTATATVVRSEPCGDSTAGDVVEVRVNGAVRQVRFDGCGHTPGQQLQVLIPANPGGEFAARPAEPEPSGSGQGDRLRWVLLSLAAVVTGTYVVMMRMRQA